MTILEETRKAILSVQNVSKNFTGTKALTGVSFSLYENEILAIIGENGAGKSTMMKILSGLYPYTEYEGEIVVGDKACKFQNTQDSENAGIAMIYQELNLELDLTVVENILLGRLPLNKFGFVDWHSARTISKMILSKLHVDIDLDVTLRSLSPSIQQLVCIARALVRDPKILILDEPTSVLTEQETNVLMQILNGLKERGISCIYISHKLDEVFSISDRIIILRDGELIKEYEQQDGYDGTCVIEDMIGRKLDTMYPRIDHEIDDVIMRVENFKVPHPYAYGKEIIQDVSFELRKGEILGLVGLVGSGRSELVNSIFGALPRISGKLYIDNEEVKIDNPHDAQKYGIGLVTEDRKKNGYVGTMSVGHNMTLTILEYLKKFIFINKAKELKIASNYFDTLRIKAPDLSTTIINLSGGNQQKVIIAKWLMTNLRIIILDEPTRGIDVGTKADIYKLIQELAAKGISILMISSELPELLGVCDRFVVLGKGVIQAEFDRDEANQVNLLKASSNT